MAREIQFGSRTKPDAMKCISCFNNKTNTLTTGLCINSKTSAPIMHL